MGETEESRGVWEGVWLLGTARRDEMSLTASEDSPPSQWREERRSRKCWESPMASLMAAQSALSLPEWGRRVGLRSRSCAPAKEGERGGGREGGKEGERKQGVIVYSHNLLFIIHFVPPSLPPSLPLSLSLTALREF